MTRPSKCQYLMGLSLILGGCSASSETSDSVEIVTAPPPPTVGLDHHHPSEGPHGGRLIELGHDHKYHAELVRDDAEKSVTVYTLDEAFRSLPIAEPALMLHLTHTAQPASFEFRGESDGQKTGYSRFVSTDSSLLQMLAGDASVNGKLRVTINGVPYVGRIAFRANGGRQ